ncbi:FadR/GntR family transcriptional regulator [Pedobacter cryoconitis]|uniref:DNA-binding FadR family transcriptional regulator n=1 Tax=Pedobacter cryoconitis TaxID=188932 RepID=A0A7X0MJT3_9SPHI|nr:FadR/GntR family transcriptional regulator [Pedobacter cryoconitis]MBB6501331.1 DNA-binding FadR family transcriptional regulator [Pedobacter cryoconitis]
MMNNNNLISRKSLADEVAEKLQQQIAFGNYKVNEKLPIEPELMKTFGVGRSTIREAIKILLNSGLLRVQQGIGTFVENSTGIKEPLSQRLKRADRKDLDEVRQLLEMKIAEKAALNRTKADLVKIYDWLKVRDKAAKHDQLEECIDADIQFHIAIAEASGNDILIDLYKSVAIHLRNWFLEIYKDTKAFRETSHQHKQLVKSIEAGDAKKAWSNSAKIIGHVSQ